MEEDQGVGGSLLHPPQRSESSHNDNMDGESPIRIACGQGRICTQISTYSICTDADKCFRP